MRNRLRRGTSNFITPQPKPDSGKPGQLPSVGRTGTLDESGFGGWADEKIKTRRWRAKRLHY